MTPDILSYNHSSVRISQVPKFCRDTETCTDHVPISSFILLLPLVSTCEYPTIKYLLFHYQFNNMSLPLSITTNNIRGLHLSRKGACPLSDHPTYLAIKPHATTSDLTILTETKVRIDDTEQIHINRFCPFGSKISFAVYTCTGLSDGILIYHNKETTSIVSSTIIVPGRVVKLIIQHLTTSQTHIIFAAYLPAGDDLLYLECIDLLSTHIASHSHQHSDHSLYIIGDLNADIYNPKRAGRSPEIHLSRLIAHHGLVDVCRTAGITDPTYFPPANRNSTCSIIDYTLVNRPVRYRNITYSINPSSDHAIISINDDASPPPVGSTIRNKLFGNSKFHAEATTHLTTIQDAFLAEQQSNLSDSNHPVYLNWLHLMIDSLTYINKKFAKENLTSLKQKEHKFRVSVRKVLAKIDKNDTHENRLEIESIKKSHNLALEEHISYMRGIVRVRKSVHHAKSHKFCFTKFQNRGQRKISSIVCPVSGVLLSDSYEIAEAFANFHKLKVSLPDTSPDMAAAGVEDDHDSTLLQLILDKHNLSLHNFFPVLNHTNMSATVHSEKIAKAIASFKNDSSPGPSGQGKSFFQFLFRFNKLYFTYAINQLLSLPNYEASDFAWIKKRKIVFIKKKKDTVATQCSEYRPISLLEQLYKILAKLTLTKILPSMTSIISSNQFGFCPGRAMSLANLSTLLLIDELHKHHPTAALVFIDIKAAFDSISIQSLKEILSFIFPDSPLPSIVHSLSAGGEAVVEVNRFLSQPFPILRGAGQGDNLSSFKYNVMHHLFTYLMWYLTKQQLPQLIPQFTRTQRDIEPICYADDSNLAIKLSTIAEAETFLSILVDTKLATGLEVNPAKSEIILPSPKTVPLESRQALGKLGRIVQKTTHLGLVIGSSYSESFQYTWEKAITKFEVKIDDFMNRLGYEDILHKKMLCSAMLQSTVTHILRVFPPLMDTTNRLDKKLLEVLWTKTFRGKSYGRPKVAKDRISHPISKGGINWKKMHCRSFTSFISSFFHTVKFIITSPNSNIAQMIPIKEDAFFRRGSLNLHYITGKMKELFPAVSNNNYQSQFINLVATLETHKDYFHLAPPLFNSNFLPHILTEADTNTPVQAAVGGLLARPPPPQPDQPQPKDRTLSWNINKLNTLPQNTKIKFENSIHNFRRVSKTFTGQIINTPPSLTHNFIYQAVHKNNSFFTKAYYKIIAEQAPDTPPAYNTRLRDKADVPGSATNFASAYRALHRANIPSHTKAFILDVLNRTAPSRKTLHQSGILPDKTCPRCEVISDNFHTQFECDMAFMAFTALSNHFSQNLPSIPYREENFCFFIPLRNASKNMNDQFLHLTGSLVHLAYSSLTHERFHRWSPTVFYAKLLSNIELTIQIRRHAGWAYREVVSFRDHFLSYCDNLNHTLTALNKGHFRAFPPSPAT